MKFGGPQKCAAVAAMAVTVMAALVHFALARGGRLGRPHCLWHVIFGFVDRH